MGEQAASSTFWLYLRISMLLAVIILGGWFLGWLAGYVWLTPHKETPAPKHVAVGAIPDNDPALAIQPPAKPALPQAATKASPAPSPVIATPAPAPVPPLASPVFSAPAPTAKPPAGPAPVTPPPPASSVAVQLPPGVPIPALPPADTPSASSSAPPPPMVSPAMQNAAALADSTLTPAAPVQTPPPAAPTFVAPMPGQPASMPPDIVRGRDNPGRAAGVPTPFQGSLPPLGHAPVMKAPDMSASTVQAMPSPTPQAPAKPVAKLPLKPAPRPAPNVAGGNWVVQFGAFHSADNAQTVLGKLKAIGIVAKEMDKPPLFLVRSAPLGHDAAAAMADKAKAAGIDGFIFATK